MKLESREEEIAMERISAIACIDKKTVRRVFEAMSVDMSLEVYRNKGAGKYYLPLFGWIQYRFFDELTRDKKVRSRVGARIDLSQTTESVISNAKEGKFDSALKFVKSRLIRSVFESVTK